MADVVAPTVTPIQVRAVHHVGLLVRDLDEALPFYTDELGLRVNPDRPEFSVRGVWLDVPGDQQVHLFEGETPKDGGQHVALRVADIDIAMTHLRERGHKVWGFPKGGPFTQCVVFDPSGNRVELYTD